MRKILGLDLGTTSVGWALLNESENGFQGIVDMGVRIFQEVTEGASKKLKNKERQEKRSARRQIERKARRKVKVAGVLKRAGFIPFTQAEYEKWEEWNR
jgi:CRISPR-associated endonuclease Csn1